MKFPCLHCERRLNIPEDQLLERVGRAFNCPNCAGAIFINPSPDGEGIELSTADYEDSTVSQAAFEVVSPEETADEDVAPAKILPPTAEAEKSTIVMKASPTVVKKAGSSPPKPKFVSPSGEDLPIPKAPPKPKIVSGAGAKQAEPVKPLAPRVVSKAPAADAPKPLKPKVVKAKVVVKDDSKIAASTAKKIKSAGLEIPSPRTGKQTVHTTKRKPVKGTTIKKRSGSKSVSVKKGSRGKRSRRREDEAVDETGDKGRRGRKGKKEKSGNKALIIILIVAGVLLVGGGITIAVIAGRKPVAPPAQPASVPPAAVAPVDSLAPSTAPEQAEGAELF